MLPDNHDAVLPPNVAPMNFMVQEEGDAFITHIYSDADKAGIVCDGKDVDIPMNEWKALLSATKGKTLYTDVYVKQDGNGINTSLLPTPLPRKPSTHISLTVSFPLLRRL